uniref:steroid 11beta-monooxygenase n=1 Tax=Apteryx owenii TaxID=8824 RepID=A0A8B9PVN8_APTOW
MWGEPGSPHGGGGGHRSPRNASAVGWQEGRDPHAQVGAVLGHGHSEHRWGSQPHGQYGPWTAQPHGQHGPMDSMAPWTAQETVGAYSCVNVLLPQDAARLFQAEGVFPRRMGIEAWTAHRRLRNHKCGVFLLNGEEWRSDRLLLNREVISPAGTRKFLPFLDAVARDFTAVMRRRVQKNARRSLTIDLHRDLFRFTLEASSYALYGERLGLLEETPDAESQRFIGAVETMLRTTLPLLFIPPRVMRWLNHRLWRDHIAAWDTIFQHADKCIQNIYQEFCLGQPRKYSGIMAELLLQAELRPLCRLYPVGITVQRYPTKDVVLHDYRVPAGTLCQVALYAMGRSPEVFSSPERYDPARWLSKDENSFKALAFGFGARQCIGRRLAEAEMMLFLMHVLRNFQIETASKEDIRTVFGFILMPEKPPLLTFRPIN